MQFELKFSKNKHKLDGRQPVTYIFDELNGLGVTVIGYADHNDEEGERVDITRLGNSSCSYCVPVDSNIRVLLSVPNGAPAVLLTPMIVAADGVEDIYPAFPLEAGDLYHLPMNIEMDADEDPNFWILRNQHDEVVLKIMIRVD